MYTYFGEKILKVEKRTFCSPRYTMPQRALIERTKIRILLGICQPMDAAVIDAEQYRRGAEYQRKGEAGRMASMEYWNEDFGPCDKSWGLDAEIGMMYPDNRKGVHAILQSALL